MTGIDLGDEVIEKASSLIGERKNLTFETGNVLDGLKYEDDSFDVVYTHQTLIHIPDPVKAIKEIRRVLKPGGVFASRECANVQLTPSTPELELFRKAMHEMMTNGGASGFHGGRMQEFVHEGGFNQEKTLIQGGATVFATKEEREWWADVNMGRYREDVGRKCLELGIVDKDGIERIVKGMEKWGKEEVGSWTAWQTEILAWK